MRGCHGRQVELGAEPRRVRGAAAGAPRRHHCGAVLAGRAGGADAVLPGRGREHQLGGIGGVGSGHHGEGGSCGGEEEEEEAVEEDAAAMEEEEVAAEEEDSSPRSGLIAARCSPDAQGALPRYCQGAGVSIN